MSPPPPKQPTGKVSLEEGERKLNDVKITVGKTRPISVVARNTLDDYFLATMIGEITGSRTTKGQEEFLRRMHNKWSATRSRTKAGLILTNILGVAMFGGSTPIVVLGAVVLAASLAAQFAISRNHSYWGERYLKNNRLFPNTVTPNNPNDPEIDKKRPDKQSVFDRDMKHFESVQDQIETIQRNRSNNHIPGAFHTDEDMRAVYHSVESLIGEAEKREGDEKLGLVEERMNTMDKVKWINVWPSGSLPHSSSPEVAANRERIERIKKFMLNYRDLRFPYVPPPTVNTQHALNGQAPGQLNVGQPQQSLPSATVFALPPASDNSQKFKL